MIDEVYLQGILKEIERAKAQNLNGIYRINAKVSNQTAHYVKDYFVDKPEYDVEIKRCLSCKNTWDILISFRKI